MNSVADTFVGTSTYMAPERIQGQKYTVKSDVWSFGLSIMELAIGKFPFDASEHLSDGDGAPSGILDLLQQIVYEPAPRLPKSEAFPSILEDMIQKCMAKSPEERPTPQELYVSTFYSNLDSILMHSLGTRTVRSSSKAYSCRSERVGCGFDRKRQPQIASRASIISSNPATSPFKRLSHSRSRHFDILIKLPRLFPTHSHIR